MRTVITFTFILGLIILVGCNKTDSDKATSSPRVITSPSNVTPSPPGTTDASSDKIQLQFFDFENGHVSGAGFDSEGNRILLGGQVIWPDGETVKNDILLAKLNPAGDELWKVRWGTENFEQAWELTVDGNDDIYLAGLTKDPTDDNMDFLLLKYSPSGDLQWEKVWGTTNTEMLKTMAVDAEHNIYAAGVSFAKDRSLSGSNPILKFSSTGEVLAGAGITMGTLTRVDGLAVAGDNLYVAADYKVGDSKKKHGLIIGLDNNLAFQWGLSMVNEDGITPRCIFETISGDLLVVGNVNREDPTKTTNLFSLIVSKQGDVLSTTEYLTASKDLIKGAYQAIDGTVYCYFRGSPIDVVSFSNSDNDPTGFTLDGGGSSVASIAMTENPSGGIELYKDDPFEPGGQWTETTLTGTKLECEITPADVEIEAVDIETYTPKSNTKKRLE